VKNILNKKSLLKRLTFFISVILIFTLVFTVTIEALEKDNPYIFLTWEDNPQTTQTITWVSEHKTDDYKLYYRDQKGEDEYSNYIKPARHTFEDTKNWIYSAKLTELTADTEYDVEIRLGNKEIEEFYFETLPRNEEITFITGSDSQTKLDPKRRKVKRYIHKLAAHLEPDFVVFTGDHIDNPLSNDDWNWWLEDWDELMITEKGRRIPIISTLGNHEVSGAYAKDKKDARFYYNYFHLPGNEKYYSLELTNDVLLISLDSGHTSSIGGEQTKWLSKTLKNHQDKETIIVQKHISAWPTSRKFYNEFSSSIREYWVPLFEKYDVDLVLEGHEHTFKISEPLTISSITSKIKEDVVQGMEKAEKNFDPEADYSPWSNQTLQKISSGNWDKTDLENIDQAMEELIYQLALYNKQTENFKEQSILDSTIETPFYKKYWNQKMNKLGKEKLINPEKGVIYLGDGGWCAELRYPYNAEDTWYLRRTAQVHNFNIVTVKNNGKDINIKTKFINPILIKKEGDSIEFEPDLH